MLLIRQSHVHDSVSREKAGWEALRSSASRNDPFGLCRAESFGNFFLAKSRWGARREE